MAKIIGLDPGTNSIGWSIRETDIYERELYYKQFQKDKYDKFIENSDLKELNLDNEIIDYGVIIFEKGVGDGRYGEFSLAAERRKNRSKRRLYNAKRYRKWELLKILVENGMCPLTMEELRLWSIGNWKEINGKRKNYERVYPISNESFQQWLSFDPAIFGGKGLSEKGNPIRKNPYDLRCELIDNVEYNDYLKKLKIGRALYHLVQRRGFKSSRKNGDSIYGKDIEYEEWKSKTLNPSVSKFYVEKLNNGERIRARKPMLRDYFVNDDFLKLCNKQNLNEELIEGLYNAIYFVRPLRSQKGLVGNCTLERTISTTNKLGKKVFINKGKPRIPISHPKFEEFRALQFINNIKWREEGTKEFVEIPITLRKKILEELFFRSLSSGKNKGKVNTDSYFKFEEIINKYSKNGTYEFNYKNLPNVSTCPTIAALMNVFDSEWTYKFIQDENAYGINWDGLTIKYKTQDYKNLGRKLKRKIIKGKVTYIAVPLKKEKTLKIDEIWHLLFDYIQTKDKEENLEKFCKEILRFDNDKAKAFAEIDIPQGYGSLSYIAISKILPFLQNGFIYSEAVLFANLKKVLGNQFKEKKEEAKKLIAKTIRETGQKKEKYNIVNGLIKNYFSYAETSYAKGVDDTIMELAWQETTDRLINYFGKTDWDKRDETDKEKLKKEIFDLYIRFLNGEQTKDEKASAKDNHVPEIDYYKLPRLDEAIKQSLKNEFKALDKNLKYLYHPSDIEMYPASKTEIKDTGIKLLESPQPPSKGWKNPMAMRTLHELRHLLNYLLKIGKIDKDTKIVVEMARELNDANKRKAIEAWQNDKKKENQEYALAISELFDITTPSDDDFNKFKAAVEQLVEKEKSGEFLKKYTAFIETFLIKKNKESQKEDEEIPTDYLMYLIITRDEFTKLLLDQPVGTGKILNVAKDFKNKRNEIKNMLTKYRLWKEQKFQCFYTGINIPFTELFSNNYQIEHTIPRSISFDSEVKNLTVCDAVYNSQVKNNNFPTECPNYYNSADCQTVKGIILCSPISARVEKMIKPKVVELDKRIKRLKEAAKKIPSWETDKKNANIRLRHYLQFELDYWEKKLLTFTIKRNDWKDDWKNSQLVDTQIISKYARAYLKTIFEKVDVQKGTNTDTFKRIYQIKGEEKKDRSKHSHHAVDAATLTLIPSSAKREAMLKMYYQMQEEKELKGKTSLYYELLKELAIEVIKVLNLDANPYKNFDSKKYKSDLEKYIETNIRTIENLVIINHITHDKTLTNSHKIIRNRSGKIIYKANGDSIRGQINEDSYLGAINPPLYDNNKAIKENGKWKTRKNNNGEPEIWIVKRLPVSSINFEKDVIIDKKLKDCLSKQIKMNVPLSELRDLSGKIIRHIRCRVKTGKGFQTREKAIELKKHSHLSDKGYKQNILSKVADNYLCLFYQSQKILDDGFVEYQRQMRVISLFHFNNLGFKTIKDVWQNNEWNIYKQNDITIPLHKIIRRGTRAIFFNNSVGELSQLSKNQIAKRLFMVYKFNESFDRRTNKYSYIISFKNNLDARPTTDIDKECDNQFNSEKYQAGLSLKPEKMNCIFENIDFDIEPDGTINLIK